MAARSADHTETETQEGVVLPRRAPPHLAVLVVIGSAAEGGGSSAAQRVIPFADSIEIGRDPEGPVVCRLADGRVSGRHARVSRTRDGFKVSDLGSKNGTLVDGRQVSSAKVGDRSMLFLAGHALMLRLVSEDALAAIREDLASPFGPVATAAADMALPVRRLRRLAATDEAVLIAGETGAGKEVYARAVHQASGRKGRFVPVDCASLPMDLVESELYGFVRGAHAAAVAGKPGLFDAAEGGTLFLDKIDDMPGAAQAKLLRFLETRSYTPLGAGRARTLDVRVIGATSSLQRAQDSHGLRPDLLARFGADPVVLPPLLHRREDLGMLARHFLGRSRRFEAGTLLALCLHDWPQNVRELEKVLGAATAGDDKEIRLRDLPARLQDRVRSEQAEVKLGRRERPSTAELEVLLRAHKGNVAEVARALDRHWGVVWRWMRRNGLSAEKYRA